MECYPYYTLLLSNKLTTSDFPTIFSDLQRVFSLSLKRGSCVINYHFRKALEEIIRCNKLRQNTNLKPLTVNKIAKLLQTSHHTITKELKRIKGKYSADKAQKHTENKLFNRKPRKSKLTPEVKEKIETLYADDRYAYEISLMPFCKERNILQTDIRLWIRQGKIKVRRKKKRVNKNIKEHGVTFEMTANIKDRPKEVGSREEFGHWEADTVMPCKMTISKRGKQNIATFVERKTRLLVVFRMPDRTQMSMVRCFLVLAKLLPKYAIKTVTVDQGTEFSGATTVEELTHIKVYFCDAKSPNQKGQIENRNREVRKLLSKKTYFEKYTDEQIIRHVHRINSKPMVVLQDISPYKAFQDHCISRNPEKLIPRVFSEYQKINNQLTSN